MIMNVFSFDIFPGWLKRGGYAGRSGAAGCLTQFWLWSQMHVLDENNIGWSGLLIAAKMPQHATSI